MSAFEDPARKASARPASVLSPVVATNPNALTPELFSPNRLGTGASNFRAPDKLLNNSIGHFDPSVPLGKFTDAKVHATE